MIATAFDPRAAKALKPGEYLALSEYPGLRLVATQSRRSWIYRYKSPASGLMKQAKLGEWPAEGVSRAVELWQAARGERSKGVDIGVARRSAKAATKAHAATARREDEQSCGWLVQQYLADVVEPNRKAKGAAESRRMLERALAEVAETPARLLSRQQAHQIVANIAKTAPRVAAMTRQELRGAWAYGIDRGAVTENPFIGQKLGGSLKANKRDRTLSDFEAGALLRWMAEPRSYSRTVVDALELTLRTALRSGEVCSIHSDELQERDGVLWLDIPGARMKGGEPHSVPLIGRARSIVLARMPEGGGFLFPAKGGDRPIEQKVLGVEVYACSGRSKAKAYAARRICPVKNWAPHDLRRTARTMLAELGCPFEVGEAIVAHTLPGVASVYVRSKFAPQKIEWLGKLGQHLDELAAVEPAQAFKRATGAMPKT